MAIKYTIDKYGVSFPTKVAASAGSPHIYNITLTNDTPNGKIIHRMEKLLVVAHGKSLTVMLKLPLLHLNWKLKVKQLMETGM